MLKLLNILSPDSWSLFISHLPYLSLAYLWRGVSSLTYLFSLKTPSPFSFRAPQNINKHPCIYSTTTKNSLLMLTCGTSFCNFPCLFGVTTLVDYLFLAEEAKRTPVGMHFNVGQHICRIEYVWRTWPYASVYFPASPSSLILWFTHGH